MLDYAFGGFPVPGKLDVHMLWSIAKAMCVSLRVPLIDEQLHV